MIRATLVLMAVVLAGVGAVLWTARNLDPLRVVERIAPARVHTVDLSGSGAFPRGRPEDEAPPVEIEERAAPPAAAAASPVPTRTAPPASPVRRQPEPVPEREPGSHAGSEPELQTRDLSPRRELREAADPASLAEAAPGAPLQEPAGGSSAASDATAAVAEVPLALEPRLAPDESAALIRRMLALYERAGEPR